MKNISTSLPEFIACMALSAVLGAAVTTEYFMASRSITQPAEPKTSSLTVDPAITQPAEPKTFSLTVDPAIQRGIENPVSAFDADAPTVEKILKLNKEFCKELDSIVEISEGRFSYKTGEMRYIGGVPDFFVLRTNLSMPDGDNMAIHFKLREDENGKPTPPDIFLNVKKNGIYISGESNILEVISAAAVNQGMIDPSKVRFVAPVDPHAKGVVIESRDNSAVPKVN